jgi:hypothetical protein
MNRFSSVMVRSAGRSLSLIVCLLSLGAVVPIHAQLSEEEAEIKRHVENGTLVPAIKMLEKKKVPFDAKLLLDDDWRTKLAGAFAAMPELKTDIRVTHRMKGVYLARTLLVGRHVELDGDTVILAKEFAPDDENSSVMIEGDYRLIVWVIGDAKVYEAMRRKRARSQFLNIDLTDRCGLIGIPPIFIGRTTCRGMALKRPW